MEIKRIFGSAIGRSRAVAYGGLVWAVGNAQDESLNFSAQMRESLHLIDQSLAVCGTDKTRLLSAQIFLADILLKPEMDEIWNQWIGSDHNNWPQRTCLGVTLTGKLLIEITIVAAQR